MKYAIVENGGKQYKAVEGSTIVVDLLSKEVGDEVVLENVLLLADDDNVAVGTPTLKGAKITAKVDALEMGPKLIVFKYRPKKHSRVKTGHRQKYTRLVIDKIEMEK